MPSAEAQLKGFLAKFTPEVAGTAKACIAAMRRRYPTAVRIVYDNYNALVVGFGPSERASEAMFSIAVYPRWVNLFFLRGANLPDPEKLLLGSGNIVRRIMLRTVDDLNVPGVITLMHEAVARAERPFAVEGKGRLVIRAISAKQRARR
jgi:hypothetical protein